MTVGYFVTGVIVTVLFFSPLWASALVELALRAMGLGTSVEALP